MCFKPEGYVQLQLWPVEELPPLQLHGSEEEQENQPIQPDTQPSFIQLTLPRYELDVHIQ
jgi:hypothetical protein